MLLVNIPVESVWILVRLYKTEHFIQNVLLMGFTRREVYLSYNPQTNALKLRNFKTKKDDVGWKKHVGLFRTDPIDLAGAEKGRIGVDYVA